jgi:hypothetical protein
MEYVELKGFVYFMITRGLVKTRREEADSGNG